MSRSQTSVPTNSQQKLSWVEDCVGKPGKGPLPGNLLWLWYSWEIPNWAPMHVPHAGGNQGPEAVAPGLSPPWWKHLSALPCSHPQPPHQQWFSTPGWWCLPRGLLAKSADIFVCHNWGCVEDAVQSVTAWSIALQREDHLARKGSSVGGCTRHCGLVSVPGFYSLNASSSHPRPHPLQVTTSRNVTRHHQMSPAQAR